MQKCTCLKSNELFVEKLEPYLVQLLQQLFLLRRGLSDGGQSMDLCSDYLQLVLLPCCQALDGDLCFHHGVGTSADGRRGELVLRGRCSQRLGRLRHWRHFLLIGSRLRGGPRQRLQLNLNVRLLRRRLLDLTLCGRFGGLGNLVVDDEQRRM